MKSIKYLALAFTLFLSAAAFAQKKLATTIGDAKMDASKNIMQNLEASSEFSSMGKVFANGDLKEYLSEAGPYTILAPTNAALNSNTKEKLTDLLNPNKVIHTKHVAAYHIIHGKWYASDFGKLVRAKGTPSIKTVDGDVLIVSWENRNFYLTDKNGNKAKLIITDAVQSNGILHGIDNVFSPNK